MRKVENIQGGLKESINVADIIDSLLSASNYLAWIGFEQKEKFMSAYFSHEAEKLKRLAYKIVHI